MKAVLFDLDGTIADTEITRFELLKNISSELGFEKKFTGLSPKDMAGLHSIDFVRSVLGEHKEHARAIVDERYKRLHDSPEEYIVPIKGIRRLVLHIKKNGLIIGLATNSFRREAELVLRTVGILESFDALVSIDEVSHKKPDPETYNKLMQKLDIDCSECIAVEDSESGIIAARSAGLRVIAMSSPYNQNFLDKADFVVNNHLEIFSILDKL